MSTESNFPIEFPTWLSSQRWYAGKGAVPRVERIGGWQIDHDGVRIVTHYILDHLAERTALYQVPLTERSEALVGIEPIGTRTAPDSSTVFVYDATVDSAYAEALLNLMLTEDSVGNNRQTSGSDPADTAAGSTAPLAQNAVVGHRQPGAPAVTVLSASRLTGEQSNTSIICQVAEGNPVIIKVFRALHHGENPDVTLQSAIAAAGSLRVPTSLGYLSGAWSDTGRADGRAVGHLAFAQEFLPGVQDAWRVALRAAETNEDFSEPARALGEATAEVHAILASVLPVREASDADVTDVLFSMTSRMSLALSELPQLEEFRSQIERIYDAARGTSWPALQRVHGDFHLGQVLLVPERGWVLLDFEGEPLRPMAERSQLDLTLRDIAGMLRSFDYAAGSVSLSGGDKAAAAHWASSAREAFLAGYVATSGMDLGRFESLLEALELDKALYEAVYEARNRPDWVEIPALAIQRLAARDVAPTV